MGQIAKNKLAFFEKTVAYDIYLRENKDLVRTAAVYAAMITGNVLSICNTPYAMHDIFMQENEYRKRHVSSPLEGQKKAGFYLFGENCEELYRHYVTLKYISRELLKENKKDFFHDVMEYIRINAPAALSDRKDVYIRADEALFNQIERLLLIMEERSKNELPAIKGMRHVPLARWDVIEAVCLEMRFPYFAEIRSAILEFMGRDEKGRYMKHGMKRKTV